MSRTLEIFEHGRLPVAASGDGIRQREFDELVRFNDQHGGQYFDVGYKHLKAKSFVGYVEVGGLSIEILPKADRHAEGEPKIWREGLLEMLRVALGLRLHMLPSSGQQLARNRLLDLIARAYVKELQQLLHEGLAKGYRTTQSNGMVFRGRLKVADHLRENLVHGERFFVEHQIFDHDILLNRVLATALEVLSWRTLSPGVSSEVEACRARFPELPATSATATLIQQLDRLPLTRSTQRYSSALRYARMILAQHGPQLRKGREQVFALLFDMNALWESYIATLLRRAAPDGLTIHAQEHLPLWKPQGHRARKVRPDLVIRSTSSSGSAPVVAVLDTKWKVPPNGLPSDGDLQQMFLYNELLGSRRAILLYPKVTTSTSISGSYATLPARSPHACAQRHIGLLRDATWSNDEIKAQLAALLSELAAA